MLLGEVPSHREQLTPLDPTDRELDRMVAIKVSSGGEARFEPIRSIRVRGAREPNLQGIDIDIPRSKLLDGTRQFIVQFLVW